MRTCMARLRAAFTANGGDLRLLCVQAAVVLAVTVWEIEIFLVIVRLGCTMNQAAAGITSRSTLFGMALL